MSCDYHKKNVLIKKLILQIIYLKKRDIFATMTILNKTPLILLILLTFCSSPKDPITGEIKRIEPNLNERAKAFVENDGGIFNSSRNASRGGNFEFATANPLWRATLDTFDFIPIQSANYSGGILVTDWYSEKSNKDSIKIEVRFLSNELAVSSLKVISYNRTCIQMSCEITKSKDEFNNQIKNKILEEARKISLQDKKKSKN